MSQRFINDHSVGTVRLEKIIKITAGRFRCWVESNVGLVRKPNHAVSQDLWDDFHGIEREAPVEIKLKWYQRFWSWILKIFKKLW